MFNFLLLNCFYNKEVERMEEQLVLNSIESIQYNNKSMCKLRKGKKM